LVVPDCRQCLTSYVDAILARFSLTPVEDEEKTVKLDPEPWVSRESVRHLRLLSCDGGHCTVAPGPEFSQEIEDYR
jgi:hypothetical protein